MGSLHKCIQKKKTFILGREIFEMESSREFTVCFRNKKLEKEVHQKIKESSG